MIKRLLNCSPKEMLALKPAELKDAIRMSEGRTVSALARTRGNNYIQYVTNAEVCAGFGADIVVMDTYNPKAPLFPGLPSKNPEDDEPFREIQIQIGKGWTAREIRNMIGRPLGATLILNSPAYGGQSVDTGFADSKKGYVAGNPLHDWDDLEICIEQGFDIVMIGGWCGEKQLVETTREAVKRAKGRVLIFSGVPHGPGLIYAQNSPYDLRELMTPHFAAALADAGADIIDMPAAGSLPGFTMDYVGKIVDAAHAGGAIINAGIHNSQEGTDEETIRRLAIDNKTMGVDMYMLGDAGVNENMGLPEVINALCIAVKGHRHTYRRMAESPLR